jgi:hypothetical protein
MIVNSMPARLNHELITAAIDGFEEQKKRIDAQIAELRQMLSGASTGDSADSSRPITKERRMSAAARARIAAAQRKRWAAKRAAESGEQTPTLVRKKRRLSAAGRKAIIEATKRRWAAVRAARKR